MKKLFIILVFLNFCIYSYSQDTIVAWTFPAASADSLVDVATPINAFCFLQTENDLRKIVYNPSGASGGGDKCAQSSAWDNGDSTKYWVIKINTLNYSNLKLSSKQRSCSMHLGPRDFKVQYKTCCVTEWTDIPNAVITDTSNWSMGAINTIELPYGCENRDELSLRWVMTSNFNVIGNPVESTGMSRIDDIYITGTNMNNVPSEIESDFVGIYPNPTRSKITIKSNCLFNIQTQVSILNMKGHQLISENYSNKSSIDIDVSTFPKGIYLLKIQADCGITSKKFIVQ
ncbi:MAG: T9SS type A sorting domain-containing protein [Bacteroidota bacterium]